VRPPEFARVVATHHGPDGIPLGRGSGTDGPLIGQHGYRPVLGGTSARAAELVRHSTYHEGGQSMVQQSPGDGQVVDKQGFRLGGGAIASLVGLGLLVVFMIQNTQKVPIEFLFWDFYWPIWLIVLGSALIGAIVISIVSVIANSVIRD
jgi:uncharacterized integral membrane protein